MQPKFNHFLSSSFTLFLENQLLTEGQAYSNISGQMFPSNKKKINGLNFYASPHAQWVYDSSISGANIPTGATINNVFTNRGTNSLSLDFFHGGVYTSVNNANIQVNYSKKDFNFYFKPERETELLLETMFNGEISYTDLTANNPTKIIAPCIIINSKNSQNEPFSFGGQDQTESVYQAVILTNNYYHLDGAMSIFRDLNEVYFPIIDFEDIPWDEKGDIKNGEFNYKNLAIKYPNPSQRAIIDRVLVKNVKSTNRGNNNFDIGYAEFRVLSYRYPRGPAQQYVSHTGDYNIYP